MTTVLNSIRLTDKLNPSGGASYHESSGSNKSECGIPGLVGHLREADSCSSMPTLSISCGCGNMMTPASDTDAREKKVSAKKFLNYMN